MATKAELSEYLTEHYAYELLMFRYTIKRLDQEDNQLEWNVLFESCVTHARNLRDFLTNEKDSRNHRAEDYSVKEIAARNEKQGPFNSINEQVEHLSKGRRSEAVDGKLTLDEIKKVAGWIEGKYFIFIEKCDPDSKVGWDESLVTPPEVGVVLVSTPTSSAYSTAVQSSNVPSVDITTYTIGDTSWRPREGGTK